MDLANVYFVDVANFWHNDFSNNHHSNLCLFCSDRGRGLEVALFWLALNLFVFILLRLIDIALEAEYR